MCMMLRGFATGLVLALGMLSLPTQAQDAQSVYAEAGNRVLQILIIDHKSQEKAAIGSGFLIAADGVIATNFHVVSEAVHEPEKYRIEGKDQAGRVLPLQLVDFDVIHDLAIVRLKEAPPEALPTPMQMNLQAPEQGAQIYSLGNPFDLGHTIIPGTYNGLLEQSFYQKLHFSGSLNPGMSGGPAVDGSGQVVGINVATSGNQISFLVPVKYLAALLERYTQRGADLAVADYESEVDQQLYADQDYKYRLLLDREWGTQTLGQMQVGADITEYFKCWGNTNDHEDATYETTMKSCTSQDTIYVGSRLTTGAIDIQYSWIATDELGSYRFHRVYGDNFSRMSTRTMAGEDEVTNYQCQRDFVRDQRLDDNVWRAVLCVRQYKDYPRLFDVLYQGSLLGLGDSGLASHFALSGVSMDNALAFARKFLDLHAQEVATAAPSGADAMAGEGETGERQEG